MKSQLHNYSYLLDDDGITIRGFFRCSCGKLHSFGGLSIGSYCTCGVKLWIYAIAGGTGK